MRIDKVRLIYFSPTRTTKIVLEAIADGIAIKTPVSVDVTLPDAFQHDPLVMEDNELLLIGAPVYAGRIPKIALERFQGLRANGNPAVAVVVYGNREFEDALVELSDLAAASGCVPIAGGAFIGEHSFSTDSIPIAKGRPDPSDIQRAREFGVSIGKSLRNLENSPEIKTVELPGNRPYKDLPEFPEVAPAVLQTRCTACGVCVAACPTESISLDAVSYTRAATCILCCACIKACPEKARVLKDPFVVQIIDWLSANTKERKEPAVFPPR